MAVPKTEGPSPPAAYPVAPYLYVLAVAAMVVLILGMYVWSHREEIQRIINVSPV